VCRNARLVIHRTFIFIRDTLSGDLRDPADRLVGIVHLESKRRDAMRLAVDAFISQVHPSVRPSGFVE